MPLSTATVTLDISDLLGNDFDARRTKVWATTNVPGNTLIDATGDKIRLGSGTVTLGSDGTASLVVWVPGAGANPASWQTSIHVDYPDRNANGGRATKTFGPFTITANANLADLVAEMPVQPEYLAMVLETVQEMIDEATDGTGPAIAALASRVDGYTDHGSISGAQTFNGPTGSHWFDATAATTITLSGFSDGQVVSLLCFSGAEDVTVAGLPDLELTDGLVVSAIRARGVWVTGGGGGTPAVPDSTPPSAVTTLDATGGEGQVSGAWSASTDPENAVSYRWRVWLTSGGATGEWTTTTSTTFLKTGLAAGAYTAEVYAYSAGGASATDADTATVTAPAGWSAWDEFTYVGTDGTNLSAHTSTGGRSYSGISGTPQIMSNRIKVGQGTTASPGGANVTGIPATRVRATVELDVSDQIGGGQSPTVRVGCGATVGGLQFQVLQGGGDMTFTFVHTYAEVAPTYTYEPAFAGVVNPDTSGISRSGVLEFDVDPTAKTVTVRWNGALVGTANVSAWTYSGNPQLLDTTVSTLSWASLHPAISNHKIEVYS